MSDDDLLAGAIAGRLRLLPDVQQLYPPRPHPLHPFRTLTALLGRAADQPAVTVEGIGPVHVEASIGIRASTSALRAGRAGIAAVLDALPSGTAARITIRIATID